MRLRLVAMTAMACLGARPSSALPKVEERGAQVTVTAERYRATFRRGETGFDFELRQGDRFEAVGRAGKTLKW